MTRKLDREEDGGALDVVNAYREVLAELNEFVVTEWRGAGSAIASVVRAHVGEPPLLADLALAARRDITRVARILWDFDLKEVHSAFWNYTRETPLMSRREPARKRLDIACTKFRLHADWLRRLEYYGAVLAELHRKAKACCSESSSHDKGDSHKSSPGSSSLQGVRELLTMLSPPTLAEPLEPAPRLQPMFELIAANLLLLAAHDGPSTLSAVAFTTLSCCAKVVPEAAEFLRPYCDAAPHELEPFLLMSCGDLRGLPLRSLVIAPPKHLGFPLTSPEAASYTRWVNCARQNSLKPRRDARGACSCGCGAVPKDVTMRQRHYKFVHAAIAKDVR